MGPETSPPSGAGRRTALACLACTVVAGLVVLLEATLTDLPGPVSFGWWLSSYALLLLVQLVATGLVPRPRIVPGVGWLPALVSLALFTFLLYPDHGLTAAFLVVSAATVARYASTSAVIAVIALQTVVATTAVALAGWPLIDVVAGIFVYAGFQAFGALVVQAARRETDARRELAATHAALQDAVAQLQAATRDAERLRIARDLHDLVGHQLTALALELEVASHVVEDPTGAEHVTRARTAVKELLRDVRAAVGEMRTGSFALDDGLHELARNVRGLEVSVRVSGPVVGPDQARAVLQVTREAVTNALRHAAATRLEVVVDTDETGTQLRISDDGHGADEVTEGHGLTGMRERLEGLDGRFGVESRTGAGFVITGYLPVQAGTG